MITIPFKNDLEKNQHEAAIKMLCQEYPEQCPRIRSTYEEQLKRILPEATIRSYLSIFIARKVRESIEPGSATHA